jgi:hypothetical protein
MSADRAKRTNQDAKKQTVSSALLQVIAVCITVACVATVNAYPGYYGHGEYEHLSVGANEEDQHVSVKSVTI